MKNFIRLIALMGVLLTSCKKDDAEAATGNYIKIDKEIIRLEGGAGVMSQGIVFYSYDQYDIRTFTGKYSTATLFIDTLAVGTYTYKPSGTTDYVTGKNFSGFTVVANITYSTETGQTSAGTTYTNPDSGTVVVSLTPQFHKFQFELQYGKVHITGQFAGELLEQRDDYSITQIPINK